MRASVLCVGLWVALLAHLGGATMCHPQCKWQCDDPSCPAVCHPVCERPKCEMRCEETTCARCTVNCERPVCSIRCPKDHCEKEACPKCESVCAPASCHTQCQAPAPSCSPVCEELSCASKCVKPTNCAKPKCELQCEKAACEEAVACNPAITACAAAASSSAVGAVTLPVVLSSGASSVNGPCCPCDGMNLQVAINNANYNANATRNHVVLRAPKPTFLELHHEMQFRSDAAYPCCPCFAMTSTDAPYGPTPTPPPQNKPDGMLFF